MLANSENLLGSPFRLRRKTLEQFFENSVPRSSPLYLSASTEDLREVEKWVGHIGQQLDGIIQLGVVDVEIRKVLSSQK
jgi:hypothetical protein